MTKPHYPETNPNNPFSTVEGRSGRSDRFPAMRPRDSATVILVRDTGTRPRILMGKRSLRHKFMPDKYVFPGGAVDRDDGRAPAFSELSAQCHKRLQYKTRRTPRAFALAAIRETFEETGLRLGRSIAHTSDRPVTLGESWQRYYDGNILPDLKDFTFVGRAITPPQRPRRFDARFFLVDTDRLTLDYDQVCDGAELSNLQWFTLEQIAQLDLPVITRFIIDQISTRFGGVALSPRFVYFRHGKSVIDTLN